MSSFVDLVNSERNGAIVHGLLTNVSQQNFVRPSFVSTSYGTNWSIAHIPGPPTSLRHTPAPVITLDDKYYPFWLLVIVAVFGSVTSVLTVLGNILVILAFFLDRQIRQPTNYFILSLSVSDFLIGLLSMPILTIYIYAKDWPLNAIICDIWLSLDYTVCLTSIYTVLFITIDRFCSVKMPAKYRKWRTSRKINIMIVVTWAVPTLIFFTATMVYPRVRGIANMQSGVCDVQWNKNHVFNLCLTIAYYWTTLFVMIVLYIFIYGVASNLERKSRENARKMSSLVGMAGSAMTHIGVGIGVNKSPTKAPPDKHGTNHTTRKAVVVGEDDDEDEDPQGLLAHSVLNTQNSSNSSDQRRAGGDDENSNSFESHSDYDLSNAGEKKIRSTTTTDSNGKVSRKNRRGMSVNWGSTLGGGSGTTVNNVSSTTPNTNRQYRPNRGQTNQKHGSNVKFFATSMAHSLYRNPIRLSGFTSTVKSKGTSALNTGKTSQQTSLSSPGQVPLILTSIPSEPELSLCRVYPPAPPQPRPETLAIMSEELFYERLRARQSPILSAQLPPPSTSLLTIDNRLSANFQSTSSFLLDTHCMEDVTYSTSNGPTMTNENVESDKSPSKENVLIELPQSDISPTKQSDEQISLPSISAAPIAHSSGDSSDESWRLLNSNSSSLDEHIPYIDETDFEDLGYILHRRRVPPVDSNEPIHEETIVYKSPFYIKHKHRSKSSLAGETSIGTEGIGTTMYEIYGDHTDAQKAILESPMYDSVELITYGCTCNNKTKSSPSCETTPIRHRSLRNVPREALLKTMSQPNPASALPLPSGDARTTSSIILLTKAKSPPVSTISPSPSPVPALKSSSSIQNADVERALIDFFRCSQINDIDDGMQNGDETESDDLECSLSNYNEINEETSSLLRLNEQHSSAFIDDESGTDDFDSKTTITTSTARQSNHHSSNSLMKMMVLNKSRDSSGLDTTSDDRTTTNSISLNTYSQDFSVDKIFNYESSTTSSSKHRVTAKPSSSYIPSTSCKQVSRNSWCSTSSTNSTNSSSSRQAQLPLLLLRSSSPPHLLAAVEKKRNTSSDSDAITTTTTTLTTSTQFGGPDLDAKTMLRDSITHDVMRALNQLNADTTSEESKIVSTDERNSTKRIEHMAPLSTVISLDPDTKCYSTSDTVTRDNDTSGYGSHDDPSTLLNRAPSKVTFDSLLGSTTQNSVPSSPKTKDQGVMAQMDPKGRVGWSYGTLNNPNGSMKETDETKNGRGGTIIGASCVSSGEGIVTSGSTSAKSSVKELVRTQKSATHRKSKSQNRARKALRTITFILGAFVVCWTPWHIYSAIHSLCESCKNNWVFTNPVFHCVYFLCYLNSPINPFCYALANQQFKKTFTRILKLDLRRL